MDIEQKIEKIVSTQHQLEILNKRLKEKFQNSVKEILKYNESKIKYIEENIKILGDRISNLEKQIKNITINQSLDTD